jgi:HAMP domain-containing protein
MFRTLAARAIIPVSVSVSGFVVVCCILLYSSMKQDRIEENILHANDIATVLVQSTRYAMLKEDRETLRNMVSNVGGERMVEHVRIFNKQGVIVFSGHEAEVGNLVDKDAEGCSVCHVGNNTATSLGPMEQARRFVTETGEPVLAITAPIYNEPDCANAGCHHHPSGQTVLGTLDIGLSEEPLRRNLAVMGQRLTFFTVMVVVLCVSGVAAVLRLRIVGPIRKLIDFIEKVTSGQTPPEPPRTDDELEVIARSFVELRNHLDEFERIRSN